MKTIFCIAKNINFVKEICKNTDLKIIEIKETIFNSGEKILALPTDLKIDEDEIFIFHTLWPNFESSFFDLTLSLHLLNSKIEGKINIIIPFIPYLRQDRELFNNSSIGAKFFSSTLKGYNIDKIYTIDVHSGEAEAYFEKKLVNYRTDEYFGSYINNLSLDSNETLIISPDEGGAQKAKNISEITKIPYITLKKERSGSDIKTSDIILDSKSTNSHPPLDAGSRNNLMSDQVRHDSLKENDIKTIIIVDDIIDSGKTILSVLEKIPLKLKKYIFVSHSLISVENKKKISDQNAEIISADYVKVIQMSLRP